MSGEQQLCEEFLRACGKFDKEKRLARAELGRATALFAQFSSEALVNFADEDGWTALHHASGEGHLAVLEWLTTVPSLAIDQTDADGCTALWVAACNDRREAVKHLLRHGADASIRGSPEGEPVTSPALAARRSRHPGLADLIDAETELRKTNAGRLAKQRSREMSAEEFRDSMRGVLKQTEPF